MKNERENEQRSGIIAGAIAYSLWGILPIYWKFVDHVPSEEVLAHRIVWSFVFMIGVLLITGKFKPFVEELRSIFANRKRLIAITIASILISLNWFTYIWAVNNDHVIEASLGYYINPLVSVLLGIVVLKEKLSFWQLVSFLLATLGVLNMTFHFGAVPWAALVLAISFGLYGLAKKMIPLSAMTGLTVETLMILPVALIYLTIIHGNGGGSFGDSWSTSLLLYGAGVVTAVPLLLFASGAKKIPLSMLGFLQYIAPTISLMLGVFLYHEPFTTVHLVSFTLIWSALTIYSLARSRYFVKLFKRKKTLEG